MTQLHSGPEYPAPSAFAKSANRLADFANSIQAGTKARVRAKVEWPFRIVKRIFGFTKVRYRGLKKNHEWVCAGLALVNLYQNRKRLAKINLRLAPQGA